MEKPSSLLSVHPNRVFGAKFKKKRKFDLWNTKEQIIPSESNIEIVDIAWLCGDTKFLFQCWKVFYEWAQKTSKMFCSKGCLLLYKHQWNAKPFHLNFFAAKGAIHCATIASVIFSFVELTVFLERFWITFTAKWFDSFHLPFSCFEKLPIWSWIFLYSVHVILNVSIVKWKDMFFR